ncbi:hypothetical protein TELCIR_09776 [Teladorsagia circumcincta]|uniref:Uncharacterized protein n=1 Tax=Teladorsagia circumcincta TaxID=45464 RepID=A0A2G9UDU7_TELCI|nr:hypothetical protein TELCIR_09776 [Teladorsagia circumcincta]
MGTPAAWACPILISSIGLSGCKGGVDCGCCDYLPMCLVPYRTWNTFCQALDLGDGYGNRRILNEGGGNNPWNHVYVTVDRSLWLAHHSKHSNNAFFVYGVVSPAPWGYNSSHATSGNSTLGLTGVKAYSVLRPGAYPLVWLNESFIMDNGTRDDLNSQLFKPKNIIEIICWCAIGVGGFLMILSAVLCIVNMYYFGEKDDDKRE